MRYAQVKDSLLACLLAQRPDLIARNKSRFGAWLHVWPSDFCSKLSTYCLSCVATFEQIIWFYPHLQSLVNPSLKPMRLTIDNDYGKLLVEFCKIGANCQNQVMKQCTVQQANCQNHWVENLCSCTVCNFVQAAMWAYKLKSTSCHSEKSPLMQQQHQNLFFKHKPPLYTLVGIETQSNSISNSKDQLVQCWELKSATEGVLFQSSVVQYS